MRVLGSRFGPLQLGSQIDKSTIKLSSQLPTMVKEEEDPHDVLRPFLLDMKRLLSLDDIKIYLLAENVINDDDMVKLTISAQLSKNDALINLRDIVRMRNVLDNFLNALKRSSIEDKNPGHKELFEIINEERERRFSHFQNVSKLEAQEENAVQQNNNVHDSEMNSSPLGANTTSNAQIHHADTIELEVEEIDCDTNEECIIVEDMNNEEDISAVASKPTTVTQKFRCIIDAAFGHSKRKDNQTCEPGCVAGGFLLAGLIVTAIVLLVLGAAVFTFGVYGLQGEDKCAYQLLTIFNGMEHIIDSVSGLDITLGIDTVLLGIIIVLGVFVLCLYGNTNCTTCYQVLACHMIFFIVLFVVASLVLMMYGFFMTGHLYFSYDVWNKEVINCSSPILYTAFVYLSIQYIVIGLIIVAFIVGSVVSVLVAILYQS